MFGFANLCCGQFLVPHHPVLQDRLMSFVTRIKALLGCDFQIGGVTVWGKLAAKDVGL